MPLFKSKEPDKSADQGDQGEQGANGEAAAAPTYITMEQFQAGLQPITDTLQKIGERISHPGEAAQPRGPVQPAEDPLKPKHDRIAAIDAELDSLAEAAEKAAYDGKGLGELVRKQNQLSRERTDLVADIRTGKSDPRLDFGFQTLDALSTEITSGKMEYISIAEVKASYDKYMGHLTPEMRMSPEAKMNAYKLAVGENFAVIEELKRQQWLRESQEGTQTQDQGGSGGGGRQQKSEGGIPKPEDVLSPEAIRSIKTTRHKTVDAYYANLGYHGGWEEYYEANKDYFEEGEEA
jgi:hypothetical protein